MKEIVCDRCGERRSLKGRSDYISRLSILVKPNDVVNESAINILEADLCGDCIDFILNTAAESITNHRLGSEFYVTEEKFSNESNPRENTKPGEYNDFS